MLFEFYWLRPCRLSPFTSRWVQRWPLWCLGAPYVIGPNTIKCTFSTRGSMVAAAKVPSCTERGQPLWPLAPEPWPSFTSRSPLQQLHLHRVSSDLCAPNSSGKQTDCNHVVPLLMVEHECTATAPDNGVTNTPYIQRHLILRAERVNTSVSRKNWSDHIPQAHAQRPSVNYHHSYWWTVSKLCIWIQPDSSEKRADCLQLVFFTTPFHKFSSWHVFDQLYTVTFIH